MSEKKFSERLATMAIDAVGFKTLLRPGDKVRERGGYGKGEVVAVDGERIAVRWNAVADIEVVDSDKLMKL